MPVVPAEELYPGAPYMLVPSGQRHSIGWQEDRKAGPSFVVVKVSRLDTVKVIERFPLTERGWTQAWQALLSRDPGAAEAAAARLAARTEAERARVRLAELDADSVACLRGVIFLGGYTAAAEVAKGAAYDLRFLVGRLLVCPSRSADPVVALPYSEIDAIDFGGPGQVNRWSAGQQVAWAMAFGLLGAVVGSGSSKIQTIVRIGAADCEIFFLDTQKLADALRIELSGPLKAISDASPGRGRGTGNPQPAPPEPITDQLVRLAALLEKGLLSRDEFEVLKSRLIAGG